MNSTIELTTGLYKRLENHAAGFHQTPLTVLENILISYEASIAMQATEHEEAINPTTYIYNNEKLDSSRLVLRVVSDFINQQEEDVNLYQLSQAFPNELQGSVGVANKFFDVVSQYDGKANKKHFMHERDLLDLQDGKVAVSTEWGAVNTAGFVKRARELGFMIAVERNCEPLKLVKSESADTPKYTFNGESLNESRLVLKVITYFVQTQEEDINLYQLEQAFPAALQGSVGVANKFYDVAIKYDGQSDKHHFVDESQLLDLQDGKVAVSTKWDKDNIDGFIQRASELGYNIELFSVSNTSDSSISEETAEPVEVSDVNRAKRRHKYILDDKQLSGGHLILKVITDYVNKQEEDINLYQLSQAFPNELQGSVGVANKYDDVLQKYDGQVNKRHFVKEQYLLDLQDGKVAISSEWDEDNIGAFIEQARKLGYDIQIAGDEESLAA
jgi:hypothetical protein